MIQRLRLALNELRHQDALALPWLGEAARETLLAEAATLRYQAAEPVVGKGSRTVRQSLEHCDDLTGASAAAETAGQVAAGINEALSQLDNPPCPPLSFNTLTIQRYQPGGGITPHRDSLRYRYLVALLVLAGDGRFEICPDRTGNARYPVPAPPGYLILMRAPGFAESMHRPFHRLTGIRRERVSLGMRSREAP